MTAPTAASACSTSDEPLFGTPVARPRTAFVRRLFDVPVSARVAIYGTGAGGLRLRDRLRLERPDVRVVCFVDSFTAGTKDGLRVVMPGDLAGLADAIDEIVIASVHWPDIVRGLSSRGVQRVWVVLPSQALQVRPGGLPTVGRWLRRAGRFVLHSACHLVLRLAASREARRASSPKPRIFWGPSPLINIKYHSQAVGRFGYESATVVDQIYHINSRADFDHTTQEIVDRSRVPSWLKPVLADYVVFLWAIRHFDIFHFYVDGGLLHRTPLKYREFQLLHRANKRVIVTSYGGDVQALSRSRNLLFKHAQNCDYPMSARGERGILRDIDYCVEHADFILSGVDWVDFMPYWDMLISGHFAIDTDEWAPSPVRKRQPGDPLVVLHAPNHRELKGTRFLLRACEELRAEGVEIELRLVEGAKNAEVHRLMADCDVVADQFIVGWYALFALEGMSMAKPVLTFLRPDLVELYSLFSWAGECPIVNTPALEIKETLRRLAANPGLCERLGRAGRDYVVKYHSLDAIGALFDTIYRRLWSAPARAGATSPCAASQEVHDHA
jgi:glycosyltransferase involved in cell wall biosynthesis